MKKGSKNDLKYVLNRLGVLATRLITRLNPISSFGNFEKNQGTFPNELFLYPQELCFRFILTKKSE